MKFQNPSLNSVLNGRTNERTSQKQYAPHFFKVGGIISTLNNHKLYSATVKMRTSYYITRVVISFEIYQTSLRRV